jgi:hypothetical protein
MGELGEAQREEGGRMGPWSAGGVRIGAKEKWKWNLKGEIQGAHSRTIYSVDWAKGGVGSEEGGLGRIVSGGGDGTINVFQMASSLERRLLGKKGALNAFFSLTDEADSSRRSPCPHPRRVRRFSTRRVGRQLRLMVQTFSRQSS